MGILEFFLPVLYDKRNVSGYSTLGRIPLKLPMILQEISKREAVSKIRCLEQACGFFQNPISAELWFGEKDSSLVSVRKVGRLRNFVLHGPAGPPDFEKVSNHREVIWSVA